MSDDWMRPITAIERAEAELNHWRDEAGNMHDMISRAERAEARVAELERELFGYRHMAARYEEADVLHARLRKAERLAEAVGSFVAGFEDESCDEYAVAFDNVKNALSAFRDTEDAK